MKGHSLLFVAALAVEAGFAYDKLDWNAGTGSFESDSNWLINGTTTSGHVPASGDWAYFGNKWTNGAGPYAITLGADHDLALLNVLQRCVSTYDLDGHTLDVRGQWIVHSAADVTVTNGTLRYWNEKSDGLNCYFESKDATTRFIGPDTVAMGKSGISVKVAGSVPASLEVAGGATFKGTVSAQGRCVNGQTYTASLLFRGKGTLLQPGKFDWDQSTSIAAGGIGLSDASRLEIRDEAVVDMTDAQLAVLGTSSNAVMIIDNAYFTNRYVSVANRELKVGCQGGWNTLMVTNNGVLYSDVGINLAHDSYKTAGVYGPSNALIVADGGKVVVSKDCLNNVRDIKIGAGHGDTLLILNGGMIESPGNVTIGVDVAASNNTLIVQGDGSALRAAGLIMNYNSCIRFEIPRFGYTSVPLRLTKQIYRSYNNGQRWLGLAPTMSFSCARWVARMGGRLVLLTCDEADGKNLNRDVFAQLRDSGNADLAAQGFDTTKTFLSVETGAGTTESPAFSLVLTSPNTRPGLMLLVK